MTCSNSHHLRLLLFGLHVLFIIFALLAGRYAGHAAVDCLSHDRSSLLHLKTRFSFQNGSTLVSWKNGSNCCDWEGVTCDPEYGHVVGLDLSSRGISGLLPRDILALENLMTLNLSGNPRLSGVLPDFPKNSALKALRLSGTNISGNLPNSLGNLKHLTDLDISYCGLAGALPSSVANLAQIVTLELASNYLTGSIPLVLLSLPTLEVLDLSDNQFSGELGEISNPSPSLRYIDLSSNQLQGPIPSSLFELPALSFLDLAHNDFNGTVELDLVWRNGNLTGLDLSHNRLLIEEASNHSFNIFQNLNLLGLASCGLTKLPAFLEYQNKMEILDLSDNMIGGDIPNWIWSSGLQFLNLSNNMFKQLEGSSSLSISSIQVLDLHSNMLQGSFPFPPRINFYLDFSNNNFSSIIPSNISIYLCITSIFLLSNNNLSGEIPMSICEANNLLVIDFSYNSLSGSIPPCLLEGNNTVKSLNLRRNQLQGTIPHNITEVCNLEALDLNGNHLKGPLPRSLANCSQLNVLDLGNNHLADSFPYWLGKIAKLKVLILRENRFYGPIAPPESHCVNCTFSKLQVLDLSSNYFNGSLLSKCFSMLKVLRNFGLNYTTMGLTASGSYSIQGGILSFDVTVNGYPSTYKALALLGSSQPIKSFHYSTQQYYQAPVSVKNKGTESTLTTLLSIFTSVDFSSNAFEGEIPDVIGELQGLQALNLSHNSLTGKIPAAIGNIKRLESLDLAGNNLSGEIPQEMTSLTFLSWLNLSDNNLVGRIPQNNQFSTFSNTSFEGNQGLCGRPLSKQCSDARPNKTVTAPPSEPDSSRSTYVIGLGLFVGLGFGFGMAVVLVLQNVSWKFLKRRNTSQR